MKVETLAIRRYAINKWFNKKTWSEFWGIDVIIDGKQYHVKEDKPLFFKTKSEAIKHVRKLNKELREQQSLLNKEPEAKECDATEAK
jgi:hypothetical protein